MSGDRAVPVQTLHAGDAMGWSAFTGEGLTHFQARALSPVCTVAFSGDQLRAACDQDPALGYALMKRLMELVTERLDAMRLKLAEQSNGMTAGAGGVRKRIEVRGIVQGVGFRPFVYRVARRCDIRGRVLNSSDGVVIEAEGSDYRPRPAFSRS